MAATVLCQPTPDTRLVATRSSKLFARSYSQGVIELNEFPGTLDPIPVPLAFPELGDAHAHDQYVFVCGGDGANTTGSIQLFEYSAGTITNLGSWSSPAAFFTGVTYDPVTASLYLSDRVSGRLLVATWTPGQVLPTSWITLGVFAELLLMPNHVIDHSTGSIIGTHWHHRETHSTFEISLPQLNVVEKPSLEGSSSFTAELLEAGSTSLEVRSDPLTGVFVFDQDTGAQLGGAMTDAGGSALIAVPPLVAGQVLDLAEGSTQRRVRTRGVVGRVGARTPPSSGLYSFVPTWLGPTLLHHVGSESFGVRLSLHREVQGAAIPAVTARLAVGHPSQVVDVNGIKVLETEYTFQADPIELGTTSSTGYASVAIPIPDQAAYQGAVVAYQWWLTDGSGGIGLSEIVHAPIRATRARDTNPSGSSWDFFGIPELMAPPPAASSSFASPTPAFAQASIGQWLSACGADSSSAACGQIIHRLAQ